MSRNSLSCLVPAMLCTIGFVALLSVTFIATLTAGDLDSAVTIRILHCIADSIITPHWFYLVDKKNGERFSSTQITPDEAQVELGSPCLDWRYWNGVMNIALLRLSEILRDSSYAGYVGRSMEFCFDSAPYFEMKYRGEGKWNYPLGEFFTMEELDDCGAMGASLLELNHITPQDRYAAYINKAAHHISYMQTRLSDGTFVRSFPRRWTLWADDLYMGNSFLSRMGSYSGDKRFIDDAVCQVINFHKQLFDVDKGLMRHYRYIDSTNTDRMYWGRANGWALLAQIDLLDQCAENYLWRDTLLALFRRHIDGVVCYQTPSGLWHQLLDGADSFLETSCSAMFTYALARGVNKRYLDTTYVKYAVLGWKGVVSRINRDGQIEGICAGTVVSSDRNYYCQRPTPVNDIHGIGTVLLAGTEMLLLQKKLAVAR